MPYTSLDRLEDLINPDACGVAASEIADEGLDAFRANVKRLTPIGAAPIAERGGRLPGTARDSIERSRVRKTGDAYRGSAFTQDPIFPFIEWDTPPHTIRPRADRAPASVVATGKPRGTVKDGRAALSWIGAGGRVFAKIVRHPGTRGQHPFAIGAAITENELDAIAAPALERWARAVLRPAVRSVDRRSR